MTEWWRKLTGGLRREAIDAELREEMQTHLEMKASATGDPLAARRQFGNTALALEDARAAWGWPRIEGWSRDFRYALRGLARRPGFAVTVVVTLALGIGSSSTIFTLVDTVLIRPLPYPDPERIVSVQEAKASDDRARTPVAPGRLEDWNRLNGSFEAIAGAYEDTLNDTTGQSPERLSAAIVSPRYFSVFGIRPAIGRTFTTEEEKFGGPSAVVISDAFWRRRFSADPRVLGRNLVLDGQGYVIVGVMPSAMQHPTPAIELWAMKRESPGLMRVREARFYRSVGRLKAEVTVERAQVDLDAVQKRLGEQYPKTDAGWSVVVEPLKDRMVGGVSRALWLLFGSVTLLLLIACANVACLLLARLASRGAEIATRCSLGAGRAVIARQLFCEGLVFSLLGGLLGLAAAYAGIDILRKQLPAVPRIDDLAVDVRTLAVVAGVSILAAILFSLAPIMETFRRDLASTLTRAGRGSTGTGQRLPRLLVSVQFALATALLIGAGLFLRSLMKLHEAPLGFRADNVLAFRVGASFSEAPDATMQRHRRILDALAALPGVRSASMSTGLPGVNASWPRQFEIEGERTADGALRFAGWRVVTSGYFQTVGIPIVEGRTCRMNTGPTRPFEALVNRSFAERHLTGRPAIGRTILPGQLGAEIVGVVADSREDGRGVEPQPMIYSCGFLRYWPDSDFLIDAPGSASMISSVRNAIRELEPSRPVYAVRLLPEALHGALSQTRFRTLLVGVFSIVALVLAAVGLYGVMAYMVSRRTREIGVRVALGARPLRIAGEILRSGGAMAGAGAIAGIALAAAGSRIISTLLYGVDPSDVTTYLSAIGVLFAVALVACAIPGRRAISISPTEALRQQ